MFKSGLYKCYQLAVKNVFDVDDPKTWKSVCLSCNKSREIWPVFISFYVCCTISIKTAAVIG